MSCYSSFLLTISLILLSLNQFHCEIVECDQSDCTCSNKDEYCNLECVEWQQCEYSTLTCNTGYPCNIECGGEGTGSTGSSQACSKTIFNSNDATDLTITCREWRDCQYATINCGDAKSCNVICQSSDSATQICEGLTLNCGTSQCNIICDDQYRNCANIQVNISSAYSFQCIGSDTACIDAPPPTTNMNPTSNPILLNTINTTKIPSIVSTIYTTNSPTMNRISKTISLPTKYPIINGVDNPLITYWEMTGFGSFDGNEVMDGCIVSIHDGMDYPTVYIFGGKRNDTFITDTILKWDASIANNEHFIRIETKLPSPMICEGQYVAYHTNTNLIYMRNGQYIFNPLTDSLQTANIPSMTMQVESSCVVMDNINDLLYIIGGIDINQIYINKLQIFNIITNKWMKQENIASIPINMASSSCSLSSNSTILYTFGGKSTSTSLLQEIYRYTVSTNTWSIIGLLTKPKYNTKAIYMTDCDKILIIGGQTDIGYIGEIEIFDVLNEGDTTLDNNIYINDDKIDYYYNGYLMAIYLEKEKRIYLWGINKINNSHSIIINNAIRSNPIISSPSITSKNDLILIVASNEKPTMSSTTVNISIIEVIDSIETYDINTQSRFILLIMNHIEISILIAIFIIFLLCFCVILYCFIKQQYKFKQLEESEKSQIDKLERIWNNKYRVATESHISYSPNISSTPCDSMLSMKQKHNKLKIHAIPSISQYSHKSKSNIYNDRIHGIKSNNNNNNNNHIEYEVSDINDDLSMIIVPSLDPKRISNSISMVSPNSYISPNDNNLLVPVTPINEYQVQPVSPILSLCLPHQHHIGNISSILSSSIIPLPPPPPPDDDNDEDEKEGINDEIKTDDIMAIIKAEDRFNNDFIVNGNETDDENQGLTKSSDTDHDEDEYKEEIEYDNLMITDKGNNNNNNNDDNDMNIMEDEFVIHGESEQNILMTTNNNDNNNNNNMEIDDDMISIVSMRSVSEIQFEGLRSNRKNKRKKKIENNLSIEMHAINNDNLLEENDNENNEKC